MNFVDIINQYISTTPVEVIAAQALFTIGWVPIAGVIIWGLLEIWLDMKQGQYWSAIKWTLLSVNVPQDAIQSPKGMENFFNVLAGSKSAITWKEKWFWGKFQAYFSFEIVSVDGKVDFYIRTPVKYRDLIEAAFYAQYPEAQIAEVEDNYFNHIPNEFPDDEYDVFGSEMRLAKKSFLPLKTYELFEHQGEKDLRFKDPILSLLEIMGKMRPGETYMIQLMIMSPDSQDWIKNGRNYIEKTYGVEKKKKQGFLEGAFGWIPQELLKQTAGVEYGAVGEDAQDNFKMFKLTPEERDQLDAIKEKISKIGWLSKIRFVYAGKREVFRKGTIASMTKGYFHQFAHLNWNKLSIAASTTTKDDYFHDRWRMPTRQKNIVNRYKNRSFGPGASLFMLNNAELATLFHFPPADARTPVLTSVGSRRSEAPLDLGFAALDSSVLQNLNKVPSGIQVGQQGTKPSEVQAGPLSVPKPTSPTYTEHSISENAISGVDSAFDRSQEISTVHEMVEPGLPQAGMPAPLPPGLDLNDQSLPPAEEIPDNLPLDNLF